MFQFSELLGLAIGAVTLVYLVSNWRRIRQTPTLRLLAAPLILMAAAWTFTVIEGIFLKDLPSQYILIFQQSAGLPGRGGLLTQLFNLLEHAARAAAAVWLLGAVLHLCRTGWRRPT